MPRKKLGRDVSKARNLRKQMSLPEALLWRLLRRAPNGITFRRQHPIGPYVLDFYCASQKLAIEVDGIAHDMGDRPQRDDARMSWLKAQNIEVLRIPARDVLADPNSVADALIRLCAEPLHHSLRERSPSPSVLRKDGEDQGPSTAVPPHFHFGANGEGDQPKAGGGVP